MIEVGNIYDFDNNNTFQSLRPGSLVEIIGAKLPGDKFWIGTYLLKIDRLPGTSLVAVNIKTGGLWGDLKNFKFKIIKLI